jgi:hypothetical protein
LPQDHGFFPLWNEVNSESVRITTRRKTRGAKIPW